MTNLATELAEAFEMEAGAAQNRGAATRAALLRAGAEVIEEGGYGGASVVAIAQRAGVSTGALYRHFPSKADLFVELFRRVAAHELQALHAAAVEHASYVERLEAVLRTYASRALASPRLTWAIVYEPVDPIVDAERLADRRTYREEMATLIRAAVAAREIPEQNADVSAAAVVGALAEALVGPISPTAPEGESPAELIDAIVDFCRGAIGAPTAR